MVTRDDARKYLGDCEPENCFWVNNGPILKNLYELSDTLASLRDDLFSHHVNQDKNDFSSWIRDVIGDQKLANDIISSRNRESMSKKVQARLNALKRKASG